MPELLTYWTKASRVRAATKSPTLSVSGLRPKTWLAAEAARNVAQDITAVLKRRVVNFLLKRTEEHSPSAPASNTATFLSKRSNARNMNVSETEMRPLTLGIRMV